MLYLPLIDGGRREHRYERPRARSIHEGFGGYSHSAPFAQTSWLVTACSSAARQGKNTVVSA
jgi:hypothetical protein